MTTRVHNLIAVILLTVACVVGVALSPTSVAGATPAHSGGFGGGNYGGQPGPAPLHLPQLAHPMLTLAGVTYSCGAITPNLSLFLPAPGCQGWDIPINANSSFLDLALSGQADIPGVSATGTIKAQIVNATVGYQIGGSYGTAGFLLCSTGTGTTFCNPAQQLGFAPLNSPVFTGNPTAPTPSLGDNSQSLATTTFVKSQGYLLTAPVTSVFGRAGGVLPQAGDYSVSQITGAAPIGGPIFQGTVTIPNLVLSGVAGLTQCLQVNSSGLVSGTGLACGSGGGGGAVSSVFGRVGAVVAASGDYSVGQITGAASIVSPNFTGSPTVPTVGTGDNSTSAANTAWVRLQGYITGTPVASVFGRIGAVTAQTGDYGVAQITGAAPLNAPTFTGSTTIPTLTLSGVTGLTQCLHVDSVGLVSGTGTDCGAGGGGGGNVTGSGLTTNALVVGSGGSAVAALGSLGTTTTVLIGNAAGLPSWGAVNLATMVTGTVATGNLPFTYTGSTTALVTAGTFTGAAGTGVCKDASSNLTTTGCSFGTVSSVFGRTGVVVAAIGDYTVSQVTGAAPTASPSFSGNPTAPTPLSGDNSASIATTQFVKGQNYLTVVPVTSVFTRNGAITAQNGDYSVAQITGAAPLASPTFSGTVTLPAPILNNVTGSTQCLHVNTAGQVSGSGADCGSGSSSGTVTSVGLNMPSGVFSVAGSPVTSTGTLAVSFQTQGANGVLAGPISGAASSPTFRALVVADIPGLPASQITSGQLQLAQGGTNADLSLSGGVGFVLKQSSSHVITAAALAAADIPNLTESQVTSLVADLAARAQLSGATFAGAVTIPALTVGTSTGVTSTSGNTAVLASAATTLHTATLGSNLMMDGAGNLRLSNVTTDSTGNSVTIPGNLTVAGIIATGAAGGPGTISLPGSTATPTLGTNVVELLGPTVATFSSYALRFSSAAPGVGGGVVIAGTPVSGISAVTYGSVPKALGGTGVSDAAYSGTTDIACSVLGPAVNGLVKFDINNNCVPSAITDDGLTIRANENLDLVSQALLVEVANASGGTSNNHVAIYTGAPASQAATPTTSYTGDVIGVVQAGAATTGSAQIARGGQGACAFDGSTTAGDYVQLSNTITSTSPVAGDCHDSGASRPASGGPIMGHVLATNIGAGTYEVMFDSSDLQASPYHVCSMVVGGNNQTIGNGDVGPQYFQCAIPYAATVREMDVIADQGTPTVSVVRNRGGTRLTLTASNLSTGAVGVQACANGAGAGTGVMGSSCTAALQNTTLAAGDYLELGAGGTASTAHVVSVTLLFTVN